MAEIEQQPLKKRKIYDAFLSDSSQSQTLTLTHASPPPQDDLATKRRNRDEVRNLHALYRRIKYCVDRQDTQIHQTYISLIDASKGRVLLIFITNCCVVSFWSVDFDKELVGYFT